MQGWVKVEGERKGVGTREGIYGAGLSLRPYIRSTGRYSICGVITFILWGAVTYTVSI